MKIYISMIAVLAGLSIASVATADEQYPFKVGATMDFSYPSGVALGAEFRLPTAALSWFKLQGAATYSLSGGAKGGIVFDFLKFPIAPVANVDLGWQSPFSIPTLANSPSVGFTYCDLNFGLAVGNRDGFRILIMTGETYFLSGNVSNMQNFLNVGNGISVGNASFHGWTPNFKLGFNFLF